jgi:rubrerythrin
MDIFEYAMKMERDGEKFYRDLASRVGDKGLESVLNVLADEEVDHLRVLERMQANQECEVTESPVLVRAKQVFQDIAPRAKEFAFSSEEIELYRKALEIEEKSETLYRKKAAETDDECQRDLLLRIAEQERKHKFLIENMIEFMSRPKTWLEDAEWTHLERY